MHMALRACVHVHVPHALTAVSDSPGIRPATGTTRSLILIIEGRPRPFVPMALRQDKPALNCWTSMSSSDLTLAGLQHGTCCCQVRVRSLSHRRRCSLWGCAGLSAPLCCACAVIMTGCLVKACYQRWASSACLLAKSGTAGLAGPFFFWPAGLAALRAFRAWFGPFLAPFFGWRFWLLICDLIASLLLALRRPWRKLFDMKCAARWDGIASP